MEQQPPAYYRARISAILELIGQIPVSDEKNNDRVLFRNGFIPENMQTAFDETLAGHLKTVKQHPLSFTELCSFNT